MWVEVTNLEMLSGRGQLVLLFIAGLNLSSVLKTPIVSVGWSKTLDCLFRKIRVAILVGLSIVLDFG